MRKTKYLVLPEDPKEALLKIADILDENIQLKGHRYPDGVDKRSFEGYWQPVVFFIIYRL